MERVINDVDRLGAKYIVAALRDMARAYMKWPKIENILGPLKSEFAERSHTLNKKLFL